MVYNMSMEKIKESLIIKIDKERDNILCRGMIPKFLVMNIKHYHALNFILRDYHKISSRPGSEITMYNGLAVVVVPSHHSVEVLPRSYEAVYLESIKEKDNEST